MRDLQRHGSYGGGTEFDWTELKDGLACTKSTEIARSKALSANFDRLGRFGWI